MQNKILSLIVIAFLITNASFATSIDSISMPFIKNMGQAAKHVDYYANTPKAAVFVNKKGQINYKFSDKSDFSHVIRESFVSGKTNISGTKSNNSKINFFIGKDKSKHVKNTPNFSELQIGEVWQGINVSLIARPGNIEKIFRVAPGMDSKNIKIKIEGQDSLSKSKDGQLLINTKKNTYAFTTPIAWQYTEQGKVMIDVAYQVDQDTYGFALGDYDPTKELIIDPLLSSTYIGGSKLDFISGMQIDADGNIVLAGYTLSTDFPTTTGSHSESISGSIALFALRINKEMSSLLAATYIGGSGADQSSDVAFDKDGNIYFAGRTSSTDFPVPEFAYTPFQSTLDENGSIHITKLSADFSSILGSTYLGGDLVDAANSIEISASGNAYISGETSSSNFPFTMGAHESSGQGAFISAFNSDLSQLVYSTKLGGDLIFDLTFDSDNTLYVAGTKASTSAYTTTAGAYSETPIDGAEGNNYIARMSEDLSTLISATFVGKARLDSPYDIELTENEVIVGFFARSEFPVTTGSFDTTPLEGGSTLIFKMDKALTTINKASYIDLESGASMTIENSGDILLFGATVTDDFPGGKSPTTSGENDRRGGSSDFGLVRLNPDLSEAKNAIYLGGKDKELHSVDPIIDSEGNIIIAGATKSNDIETPQSAFGRAYKGDIDIILQKATSDFNQTNSSNDLIFCNGFESLNAQSCN